MDKITIGKDYIAFDDTKLYPPFDKKTVDDLLGSPFIEEWDVELDSGKIDHCIRSLWNNLGIAGFSSEELSEYTGFAVYVEDGKRYPHAPTGTFTGQLLIGKKDYRQCKMKRDYFTHEMKNGCFRIYTFLMSEIDQVEDGFREAAEMASRDVEVNYVPPKKKTSKYKQKSYNEPLCVFDSFNFKLIIVEQLMYKKKLIQPEFDIYEFAKEYSRRNIDVDEEGYEPIKEAVKWFKDLQIPLSLADEVTELVWDGGLHVFHQIIPFWDGEDDYFDIKKLSKQELSQFKNLKNVTAGEGFSEEAIFAVGRRI